MPQKRRKGVQRGEVENWLFHFLLQNNQYTQIYYFTKFKGTIGIRIPKIVFFSIYCKIIYVSTKFERASGTNYHPPTYREWWQREHVGCKRKGQKMHIIILILHICMYVIIYVLKFICIKIRIVVMNLNKKRRITTQYNVTQHYVEMNSKKFYL